jgi:hypothetical protein
MKPKFMWSRPPRITGRSEPGAELVMGARRKVDPVLCVPKIRFGIDGGERRDIPSRSFLTLTFVSANVLSRHKIRSNRAWAATSQPSNPPMERVSHLLIVHCERNVRESDKNSDVLRAAA